MTYDKALAGQVEELVGDLREVRRQPMFGVLARLVDGNMAVAGLRTVVSTRLAGHATGRERTYRP